MRVDVVVVAYRSTEHLRSCVEPLSRLEGVSVFVVDNDCPENSVGTVADLPLEVVRMGFNAGFGAGCNAGAARGSGDAILFLNPDARIDREGIEALVDRLDSDHRCGAVGPRIVDESGDLHLSMRRAPRIGSAFGEALFFHRLLPRAGWATEFVRSGYGAAKPAEWISGAVLCVRRSAFARIGGFDERFFMYSEDADLCARLHSAGYGVWYDPAATAVHVGGVSAPARRQMVLKARARGQYVSLHSEGVRRFAFRAAFALYEALRVPIAAVRSRAHARGRLEALSEIVSGPARPADRPETVDAER